MNKLEAVKALVAARADVNTKDVSVPDGYMRKLSLASVLPLRLWLNRFLTTFAPWTCVSSLALATPAAFRNTSRALIWNAVRTFTSAIMLPLSCCYAVPLHSFDTFSSA